MAQILVVDDEPIVLETTKSMLVSLDHQVFEAPDGKQALEIMKNNALDLLLVDLFLPDKSGLSIIEDVQKYHPDLKIVAMSGGGPVGLNFLPDAYKLGAEATLQKPFNVDVLQQTLGMVLKD